MDEHKSRGAAQMYSTKTLVIGLIIIAVVMLVAIFGRNPIVSAAEALFGSPPRSGTIYIYQKDYYFMPNRLTLRAGDTVTLKIRDLSQSHPGHNHEFMVGRNPNTVKTILGTLTADGFHTAEDPKSDFWGGVHVTVRNAHGVNDFDPGNSIMKFIGPTPVIDLPSGQTKAVPGGVGPDKTFTDPGSDLSPSLQPGGGVDMTFVVPNKPGQWEFACFEDHYEHYRNGMHGILTVLPPASTKQ